MKPCKLQRHLEIGHPEPKNQNMDFFKCREEATKKARLDADGSFRQQTSSAVEAYDVVSLGMARTKRCVQYVRSLFCQHAKILWLEMKLPKNFQKMEYASHV